MPLVMCMKVSPGVQVKALEQDEQDKLAHVQKLENTTKEALWSEDLDGFEAAYELWLQVCPCSAFRNKFWHSCAPGWSRSAFALLVACHQPGVARLDCRWPSICVL